MSDKKNNYSFDWGEVSEDQFLAEYWQKKPLLIRAALKDFTSPLSADELAGLSLEEALPSRIVSEIGAQQKKPAGWKTQHGPFSETHYSSLPESHWTLLVQHVDQWLPDVAAIKNCINFIPHWRCEDVMVSYAADQGSVGPHFDYYDVFLLQGEGARRWQLGQHADSSSPLLRDCDMRILSAFDTQQEYVVYPGDVLYVPPGIAHWGVAQGECLTYSIGFRAPSHAEILLDFSADLAASVNEDQRYRDPAGYVKGRDQAEIQAEVIESLHQTVLSYLADKRRLADWFGQYMTQTSPSEGEHASSETVSIGKSYYLADDCRSAYIANDNETYVYINGEKFVMTLAIAQRLCLGQHLIVEDTMDCRDLTALNVLLQQNCLTTRL